MKVPKKTVFLTTFTTSRSTLEDNVLPCLYCTGLRKLSSVPLYEDGVINVFRDSLFGFCFPVLSFKIGVRHVIIDQLIQNIFSDS